MSKQEFFCRSCVWIDEKGECKAPFKCPIFNASLVRDTDQKQVKASIEELKNLKALPEKGSELIAKKRG